MQIPGVVSGAVGKGVRVVQFLRLKRPMFRPGDDLVLQHAAEIAEIVAVARHTHDQVPVLVWIRLRDAQHGSVHDIELDVVTI